MCSAHNFCLFCRLFSSFKLINILIFISLHRPPEGVTGLKELAFLRDLAEQNSVKYGVDRSSDRDCSSGSAGASLMPVVKGGMMVLNQLSNLETTVGRFYINLPNRMIDLARFSLPYTDPMGDGEYSGYRLGDANARRITDLQKSSEIYLI